MKNGDSQGWKRWAGAVALVMASGAGLGCGAAPGDGELLGEGTDDSATSTEPLNGTAIIQSCNSIGPNGEIGAVGGTNLNNRITNAVTRARNQLNSSNMAPCLHRHFLSATNGNSAETIVGEMRENLPTTVTCELFSGANSGFDGLATLAQPGSPEEIRIDSADAINYSEAQLAALIIHEVAHRKGYDHSFNHLGSEEPFTIPEQLEACSAAMSVQAPGVGGPPPVPFANGPRPEELTRASFIAAVGGPGGAFTTRTCFSGGFVRGFSGRAGARIDAAAPICTDRFGNGNEITTPAGGTGGTAFSSDCGHGKVLVGIAGHADTIVNGLQLVCGDAATVRSGSLSAVLTGQERGTATGNAFLRVCPQGKAVKSVQLRVGSLVDQLRLECEVLTDGFNQTTSFLTAVGNAVGTAYRERCPVGSVMNGISGATNDAVIFRVGGTCQQVRDDGESVSTLPFNLGARLPTIPLPGQGVFAGTQWNGNTEACRPGHGLIGMTIQPGTSGNPIKRVRGLCGSLSKWSQPSGDAEVVFIGSHGSGSATPTAQDVQCPRRQFMVGWDLHTNSLGVQRIQAVCRAPHHSGAGETCSPRCSTICTSNPGFPPDQAGIIQCLNDCNARCATN